METSSLDSKVSNNKSTESDWASADVNSAGGGSQEPLLALASQLKCFSSEMSFAMAVIDAWFPSRDLTFTLTGDGQTLALSSLDICKNAEEVTSENLLDIDFRKTALEETSCNAGEGSGGL